MRIAITGSSGRVGRAIMEMALAQGHSVVSIDRVSPASEAAYPDARFIQADITDYAEFEQAMRGAAELGIHKVCQASSVNATGAAYSRWPRYDYFPLDEKHPTYNEDPYSLSKWICEQQGDSIARRYETMTISSLRFHWVVPERATAAQHNQNLGRALAKHLWGYTRYDSAARACLLALTANF